MQQYRLSAWGNALGHAALDIAFNTMFSVTYVITRISSRACDKVRSAINHHRNWFADRREYKRKMREVKSLTRKIVRHGLANSIVRLSNQSTYFDCDGDGVRRREVSFAQPRTTYKIKTSLS